MKIRIFNNTGIGFKTEITDVETGEKIKDICRADIHCAVHDIVRADLTFNIPEIDIFAIAKLSEETKEELRNLKGILEAIDKMENPEKET